MHALFAIVAHFFSHPNAEGSTDSPPAMPPPLSDARTRLVTALEACPDMPRLKQILAQIIAGGIWHDGFLLARAVAYCSNSADLDFAHLLFDRAENPTAFAYNAMIRAHSVGPTPSLSFHLFRRMLRDGIYPDRFVFPFLLRASSRLGPLHQRGDGTHSLVFKHGFERDPHVQTSLLHAYSSLGSADSARKVFDEMPERGTVTWNAVISCCVKSQSPELGLDFFTAMAGDCVEINENTLVLALSCCAGLGALVHGKTLHGYIARTYMGLWAGPVVVGSSLVHMYMKCGSLECAVRLFEPMDVKDASVWTAMIGGLANHGRGPEALGLFKRMVDEGVNPDSVTFTCVLHACSHSGLIEQGLRVFNEMKCVYGVEPRKEHFGAIVDLLGRAGLLEEAHRFVESMPFPPNQVVWGSLLHACMHKKEARLGEELGLGLEGVEGGFYVGVSNVYAKLGLWEGVCRVREMMVENAVRKESGCSLVEVNGRFHRFLVGDTRHALTMEIYRLLQVISQEILFAS